jgi:hypothetical protein
MRECRPQWEDVEEKADSMQMAGERGMGNGRHRQSPWTSELMTAKTGSFPRPKSRDNRIGSFYFSGSPITAYCFRQQPALVYI